MRFNLFPTLIMSVFFVAQIAAQGIQSTNVDGGTVVTEHLGFSEKLNDRSSLRRSWIVLNDPSSPVKLADAGIRTVPRDRGYSFRATGLAKTSQAVQAFEIRYILFDAFGEHLQTLSSTKLMDLSSDETWQLDEPSEWHASRDEVSRLLTVVTFVTRARAADGNIWRYNQKAIGDELTRRKFKMTGAF